MPDSMLCPHSEAPDVKIGVITGVSLSVVVSGKPLTTARHHHAPVRSVDAGEGNHPSRYHGTRYATALNTA